MTACHSNLVLFYSPFRGTGQLHYVFVGLIVNCLMGITMNEVNTLRNQ